MHVALLPSSHLHAACCWPAINESWHCAQVAVQVIQVTVRDCMPGEVQRTDDTCMTCPATTYSFTPTSTQCLSCPANGNCSGGATLIPNWAPGLGYWHSAYDSTYMAACPNADACKGNRDALVSCQTMAYMPPSISEQPQVWRPPTSVHVAAFTCLSCCVCKLHGCHDLTSKTVVASCCHMLTVL